METAAAHLILARTELGKTTTIAHVQAFKRRRVPHMVLEEDTANTSALEDAHAAVEDAIAQFQSNCSARAIRTSQDSEAHYIRIKAAHAQLVSALIEITPAVFST